MYLLLLSYTMLLIIMVYIWIQPNLISSFIYLFICLFIYLLDNIFLVFLNLYPEIIFLNLYPEIWG